MMLLKKLIAHIIMEVGTKHWKTFYGQILYEENS